MTDICPQSGHHSSSNIASWLSCLSSKMKVPTFSIVMNMIHICKLFFLQAHMYEGKFDDVSSADLIRSVFPLTLSWVLLVTPLPSFICADLGPHCWQRPFLTWQKLILKWQIHCFYILHPFRILNLVHCVKNMEAYPPSALRPKVKSRVEWWSGSGAEI